MVKGRAWALSSRTGLDSVDVCGKQFTHYTRNELKGYSCNYIIARMSSGSACGVSGNVNIQDLIRMEGGAEAGWGHCVLWDMEHASLWIK